MMGGLGVAIDNKGNFGGYAFGGLGGGYGQGVAGGISGQYSNAPTIFDLRGVSLNTSLSAGDGLAVIADASVSADGKIVSAGITGGAGVGASAIVGVTQTYVTGVNVPEAVASATDTAKSATAVPVSNAIKKIIDDAVKIIRDQN